MRALVVVNPNAGSVSSAEGLIEAVRRRPSFELVQTEREGDAVDLARRAVAEGLDCVIAAGGDGTVNEVVRGMVSHAEVAYLGVVPLGTGNDLARTLDLPADPEEALRVVEAGRQRTIDLIRVESGDQLRYCVNVCAGGFSGEVDRALEGGELKERLGPLAYLIGAVDAARELQPYEVSVRLDDEPEEIVSSVAVTVSNGRSCAGGLRVAPWADLEDGLLDLTLLRHGTIFELAGLGARLVSGTVLGSSQALHRRGRRVDIRSTPPMWFNVDGELMTCEPARFTVVPRMLRVAVGPAYRRDPDFG